jgi:hypothetical protein
MWNCQPARGTAAGFVFSGGPIMLDKAITLTRSDLRAYDSERLSSLLKDAREAFRSPENLAKALKRGEKTVRDWLRQLIWSVLAIQAEQARKASRAADTKRMLDGLVRAETAEQKRARQQMRATLLNAASRSRRQRQTVRVPR